MSREVQGRMDLEGIGLFGAREKKVSWFNDFGFRNVFVVYGSIRFKINLTDNLEFIYLKILVVITSKREPLPRQIILNKARKETACKILCFRIGRIGNWVVRVFRKVLKLSKIIWRKTLIFVKK